MWALTLFLQSSEKKRKKPFFCLGWYEGHCHRDVYIVFFFVFAKMCRVITGACTLSLCLFLLLYSPNCAGLSQGCALCFICPPKCRDRCKLGVNTRMPWFVIFDIWYLTFDKWHVLHTEVHLSLSTAGSQQFSKCQPSSNPHFHLAPKEQMQLS